MENTHSNHPQRTDDPSGFVAAIIHHLDETYDAEIVGHDRVFPGELRLDLRLKVPDESETRTPD